MVALNGQGKTRGTAAILQRRMTCNQSLAAILPEQRTLVADYLFQYLSAKYASLRRLTGDSGRNGLNLKHIRSIRIGYPPLAEQRKIAAILSLVDDAIEKTQAVIDQVQVVKQGVMEDLLTRGLPGRHTRFKRTNIGPIPEEWTTAAGSELFHLAGGYGPKALTFDDEGECLFIKVDALNKWANRKLVRQSTERFRETENPTIRTYGPGSLVFPKRGAAIFKNRVRQLGAKVAVDPNLMVLTPTAGVNSEFFMYLLLHIGLFNLSDNSGIPQLNNKHLYPRPFAIPTLQEQQEIANAISSTDSRIASEEERAIALAELRQALMSVLLTGELRVVPDTDAA